jgi:hypothetical protein
MAERSPHAGGVAESGGGGVAQSIDDDSELPGAAVPPGATGCSRGRPAPIGAGPGREAGQPGQACRMVLQWQLAARRRSPVGT